MKFGVYLSPWDRNSAIFGTPEYLEMYNTQLTELLTNYGDLFIVWFDGAPGDGGDGYYGGANEYRGGFNNYYDWNKIYGIVRKLQPNAIIYHDPGPDIRWVGNEKGYAGETCWSTYIHAEQNWDGRPYPVSDPIVYKERNAGVRNGVCWIPAECDVSLRRRFTYHASDNNTVKTPQKLFDIYVNSIGRGQCFDLDLPINREGQQDEADIRSLCEFGEYLHKVFDTNLIKGAKLTASNTRGKDVTQFGTNNLLDDDRYSYWATDDSVVAPELLVRLPKETTFNIIKLRENIKLGQRIDSVGVDAWINGNWEKIGKATSVGACRIIRLKNHIRARKLRLRLYSPVCVALSEFSVYTEPECAEAPAIYRNKEGFVTLSVTSPVSSIHYTIDGTEPNASSEVYLKPFLHEDQLTIRAAAFDTDGKRGEIATKNYDLSKHNWSVLGKSFEFVDYKADQIIDENDSTVWDTKDHRNNSNIQGPPQWVAIDMGATETLAAFSYTPRPDGISIGVVDTYEFHVSNDGKTWTKVAEGNFPNIRNSPVYRLVPLDKPATCRYFKFVATYVLEDKCVNVAEIGARRK